MAVLQMQRMNLVAMKRNRKAILERLQELGALEIDVRLEDEEGIRRQDTSGERSAFEKRSDMADQAIGILDKYEPEKTSLLASLAGKPLVEHSELEKLDRTQQEIVDLAERIISLEKETAEANANIQKLENQKEALNPWLSLDVPMNTAGTDQTALFLGTISEQVDVAAVLAALKEHEPPVDAADVEILSADRDATYLSVLCLRADAANAEEALRSMGFARPSGLSDRTPADQQKAIDGEIERNRRAAEQHINEIKSLADQRGLLREGSDYYRILADRYAALGELPQTENTFALSGYVPACRAQALAKELEDSYGASVELLEPEESEDTPVLLKNNPFSSNVEGILESYGLPGKGDIDPTFLMSIFYVVLFGMMLSDAAYGAIVAIACAVVIKKFPRLDPSMKKSIKLFFWCGLSTVFWGIMFGSYFGNVVNVVSANWFGEEKAIPALWFDSLNDPMRLLMFSLLLGIIHMFVGFGIKGYMLLKEKDFVGFICDVAAWYLFLVGLLLMLLPTSLFASISGMSIHFPAWLVTFSEVIAVVGALIILVMSGRRKGKKIGIRIALGLYDIYGITSWLSDLLSYSRLLALGLATGVIAQVINQMGAMFGTGVLGTIIFIVVFLVGTVLNLAINLLSAYVHSNRLEYVEFFNKFYEGGGRPFVPFKMNTEHVDFEAKQ